MDSFFEYGFVNLVFELFCHFVLNELLDFGPIINWTVVLHTSLNVLESFCQLVDFLIMFRYCFLHFVEEIVGK